MTFRGKLLQGDQIVLDDLDGTVVNTPLPTGLASWSGKFNLPAGIYVPPGDYRLELDDGRSGVVTVSPVHTLPRQPTVHHFVIFGDLQ